MDIGLIVHAECPERSIIAIRQSVLPREDFFAIKVNDDVIAVANFEEFLCGLCGRDVCPGEYDFSPPSLVLFASRHEAAWETLQGWIDSGLPEQIPDPPRAPFPID